MGSLIAVPLLRGKSASTRHLVRNACSFGAMLMVVAAGITVACQRQFIEYFSLGWALLFVACSVIPAWFVGIIAAALAAKVAPATGSEDWKIPRWCWPLALLVGGLAFMLPARPSGQAANTSATSASQLARSAPIRIGPPTPPPDFLFESVGELSRAEAFKVVTRFEYSLGEVQAGSELSIFHDSRLLAFNSPGRLIVLDLNTGSILKSFSMPDPLGSISFYPDGSRLVCDLQRDHRDVFVCDIATGRVIPLPRPKLREVPAGRKFWWADTEVLCYGSRGIEFLNLDTLEMDKIKVSSKWDRLNLEERIAWSGGPVVPVAGATWALEKASVIFDAELPAVEDPQPWGFRVKEFLGVREKDYANWKTLHVPCEQGDSFSLTPDAAKILRIRNQRLDIIYLGLGDTNHPAAYDITMPHGPDSGPNRSTSERSMKSKSLAALIYSPMKNPLNDKVVGPDRTQVKALVRFAKWGDTKAQIWVMALFQPINSGDVVADIHENGKPGQGLIVLDTTHRWWTVLERSADIPASRAPSRKELANLRSGSVEKDTESAAETTPASIADAASSRPPLPPPATNTPLPGSGSLLPPQRMGPFITPAPTVTPPPATVTPEPEPDPPDQTEKEVEAFVMEHHRKASRRDLNGLVADYAPRVDYFDKGMKDRAFILKDEQDYHAGLSELLEQVSIPIDQSEPDTHLHEVSYTLTSRSTTKKGLAGVRTFRVTMDIRRTGDGFQITKQRSQPLKLK